MPPEYFQGALHQPDFDELNQTEERLIEAVNQAFARFSAGLGGEEEYRAALRDLNHFAAKKPLRAQRLMGLE